MLPRTPTVIVCLVLACSGTSAPPATIGTTASAPAVPADAPDSRADDAALLKQFPLELDTLADSFTPSSSGLLGRNESWGAMYSARFQLGAGLALRIAVAQANASRAKAAFHAIEVGLSTQETNGRLPSSVPGAAVSASDVASAAAFFLGDACLGLLAFEHAGLAVEVETARRADARGRVASALAWLKGHADTLKAADQSAPNRLLFDARSFAACGALASDKAARELALDFLSRARAQQRADGVFVEGGGADTSYQAVNLDVGSDLLPFLEGQGADWDLALDRGARWLAGRTCSDGSIDSAGNTRTCDGGEQFLGEPKRLAVTTVFLALARTGVRRGENALTVAARDVSGWLASHGGTDPCFDACP